MRAAALGLAIIAAASSGCIWTYVDSVVLGVDGGTDGGPAAGSLEIQAEVMGWDGMERTVKAQVCGDLACLDLGESRVNAEGAVHFFASPPPASVNTHFPPAGCNATTAVVSTPPDPGLGLLELRVFTNGLHTGWLVERTTSGPLGTGSAHGGQLFVRQSAHITGVWSCVDGATTHEFTADLQLEPGWTATLAEVTETPSTVVKYNYRAGTDGRMKWYYVLR